MTGAKDPGIGAAKWELYQELLARGALAAYEVEQRFYEIGSFAGLEETRQYLAAPSHFPRSTP